MKLNDAKIIVTGAAQGLGFHFAKRLAEEGASVAAGDVNEEGLARLQTECAGAKGRVFTRRLNVASEADIGAFVAFAFEQMGGLNGLVNNAGILRDGLLVKRDRASGAITKLSREQWQAGHRREPHRRDADGARRGREDGRDQRKGRDRQHQLHRPPRQPRAVQLLCRQGRPRHQHQDLVPRVRQASASASAPSPRHGRDADDRRA
jgi:hypothetical protein